MHTCCDAGGVPLKQNSYAEPVGSWATGYVGSQVLNNSHIIRHVLKQSLSHQCTACLVASQDGRTL